MPQMMRRREKLPRVDLVLCWMQVFLVRIGTKTYAMKMLLKDHVLACKMGAQVNAERDIGMECDSPFMVNLYGTFRSVQLPLRARPVRRWWSAA
jgi:hypothetical protein